MLDSYLEMLVRIGEGHKRSAKKNQQYAVWLVEAVMFLGKDYYKNWFLTEEPSTYFTWSRLVYTFTNNWHPLNRYTFVLMEV